MPWYVKTESLESKQHEASIVFHGPMSLFAARIFKLGIEYVDDPTIISMLVDMIPQGARIREMFQDNDWPEV